MNLIEITPIQLVLCLIFIVISSGGSILLKLGLEKDLIWGTIRTFAQLFLMGYILTFIFQLNNVFLILLLFTFMIFWAAHAIKGRVKEEKVSFFIPTFISMLISYMIVTIIVTAVIVQVKPWYTPQYFIPLGGMIIGNAMNAVTIALDRLFSDLRKQRAEIELAFCLGATYQEATQRILRDVIKAGMIPSINALMTVGLVSLPGMMTGQILAGSDPLTAIKYQIIVMLMIVASTAIGAVIIVHVVRRRCFTRAHQMIV
ncbi:MAG: iron export ABC transporter permease subunit FetB [Candidatus Latescibacteria bacterium]|jgi:putative ABC transport system permease protein|nr:iron export ABC transporter permease subunit FetB [Candidatus Latescibacterota bacterium]